MVKCKIKTIIYFLFVSFSVSGCATATFKANPLLEDRIRSAKTIAVFPMDVEVYKVSAGGVKELVDEFTEEAKTNIKLSLEAELLKHGNYHLQYLPPIEEISDPTLKQLFKDILALFRVVDTSIILHTYKIIHPMQGIFEEKMKKFDYSLGSQIKPINGNNNADMLLFLRGGDYLSSGGRVALMVWATLMGFTPMTAGPPHLSAALVDPNSGEILWYDYFGPEGGYNFRNKESVAGFTKVLFRDFPKNE